MRGIHVHGPRERDQLVQHGIARTYWNLDDDGDCYVHGDKDAYIQANWASEFGKLEACLSKLRCESDHPLRRRIHFPEA